MPITSKEFTEFLLRRADKLDEIIIADINKRRYRWIKCITPLGYVRVKVLNFDGWIGHVEVGKFKPFNSASHTFDRINKLFPDLSGEWTDVVAGMCDPDVKVDYARR